MVIVVALRTIHLYASNTVLINGIEIEITIDGDAVRGQQGNKYVPVSSV